MALLLYFLGNFNFSLTAKGTTEDLEKKLQEVSELPEEKRWATFDSFDAEKGKSAKITIFNPAVTLSHVIEEDDEVLRTRMEEQKRKMKMRLAQEGAGVFDLPRRSN